MHVVVWVLDTLFVTLLAKTHAAGFDCTDGKLDVLPETECFGTRGSWSFSYIASAGFVVYTIIMPSWLLRKLRGNDIPQSAPNTAEDADDPIEEVLDGQENEEDEEANDTRDPTRNASEATSKAARDFEESYAWVTRKYKPGRQWFEVAFIGYKVVTVSSTRECILLTGAQCV